MQKKELHITHLKTLWRCGEQYRRRYILGHKIPPGIALIIGTGTHRAIEENLKHKIEKQEFLPIDIVQEVAFQEVKNKIQQEGIFITEEEKTKGIKKISAEAQDTAVALSTLHYKKVAPKLSPIAVEESFKLKIKGSQWNLAGTIDIKESRKKKISLRDTKTALRSWSQQRIHTDTQITFYALSEFLKSGNIPEELYIDVLKKTKEPVAEIYQTKRDKWDLDSIIHRIKNAIEQLEKGVFPPTNTDNWWCNPKFCGYYQTCPYVNGRKIIS